MVPLCVVPPVKFPDPCYPLAHLSGLLNHSVYLYAVVLFTYLLSYVYWFYPYVYKSIWCWEYQITKYATKKQLANTRSWHRPRCLYYKLLQACHNPQIKLLKPSHWLDCWQLIVCKISNLETKIWKYLRSIACQLALCKKCKILLDWSGDQGLDMYQTWGLESSDASTAIYGLNGRISAKDMLMNLEIDMIFSSHSARQVHVLMNGITQFSCS